MLYVNGEPRPGDPYATGWLQLPVLLRKGVNDFLFSSGRGEVPVKLSPPRARLMLNPSDLTLPDLRRKEPVDAWGAVIVMNASTETIDRASIRARLYGRETDTLLSTIPPLSIRKFGFRMVAPAPGSEAEIDLSIEIRDSASPTSEALDSHLTRLRVRGPEQTRKETFTSEIDGSIQYYAVNPAWPGPKQHPPALILTLHGAGVEAIGQADAYSSKSWCHIVAPTNRRPYGFDWEDWGRLDAMEVLTIAQQRLAADPARTYLTGHSMGGHGTWQVGVTFPGRFAAIGPSAGWVSFWSYGAGPRREAAAGLQDLLARASNPSDTLSLVRNLTGLGVYVLHGDADDNVPVQQARTMREQLTAFHHDWDYHEQPGAGHWWDASEEPGADCVDWAQMFDAFSRRSIPPVESVREVTFTTANPGVSAERLWLTIESQEQMLVPSTAVLRCDPVARRFSGTTQNVARLSLAVGHLLPGGPMSVVLDGGTIDGITLPAGEARIRLEKSNGMWFVADSFDPTAKGPARYGPFREAFTNRVKLVYGTRGTPEETAWALAKARFDSEVFWYRGNGSLEVVADVSFDPAAEPHHNVVLYGNADTHEDWDRLLAQSPVQVNGGTIKVGERRIEGNDLACLFIRPRADSNKAAVGVVSGSGLSGMRLCDRVPIFVSGVGIPDLVVLGADSLSRPAEGVRAAGYFGPDWSVERGEIAFSADQR
jgi:dienelactone hydrolase